MVSSFHDRRNRGRSPKISPLHNVIIRPPVYITSPPGVKFHKAATERRKHKMAALSAARFVLFSRLSSLVLFSLPLGNPAKQVPENVVAD